MTASCVGGAGGMNATLNSLLDKTSNWDKDERYMATNDLCNELQKDIKVSANLGNRREAVVRGWCMARKHGRVVYRARPRRKHESSVLTELLKLSVCGRSGTSRSLLVVVVTRLWFSSGYAV